MWFPIWKLMGMTKHPITRYREERDMTLEQFAALLGLRAPAICKWEKGGRKISAERAVEIEQRVGIPRHELRPDLFSPAA